MEVMGLDQDGETPVCANAIFKFMDPNTFNRWRRQYFADHGLGEFGPAVPYTDSTGRKRWRAAANTIGGILGKPSDAPEATERPTPSEADKAAIAQRMADGASPDAAISAVRPDASVLDLLGL